MEYLLLAAGVIFMALGSAKIKNRGKDAPVNEIPKREPFDNALSSEIILQKLDGIESRLDIIEKELSFSAEGAEEDGSSKIQPPRMDDNVDINSSIAGMLKDGFRVDEVSEKYGVTKGEVLLRAHLKERVNS